MSHSCQFFTTTNSVSPSRAVSFKKQGYIQQIEVPIGASLDEIHELLLAAFPSSSDFLDVYGWRFLSVTPRKRYDRDGNVVNRRNVARLLKPYKVEDPKRKGHFLPVDYTDLEMSVLSNH